MADARLDQRRGPDARDLHAAAPALAGRRRARSGRADHRLRPRRSGRARSRSASRWPTRRLSPPTTPSVTATVTGPDGATDDRAAHLERPARRPLHRHGAYRRGRAGTRPGSRPCAARRGSAQSTAHVNAGPGDAEFSEATRQMAAAAPSRRRHRRTRLHARKPPAQLLEDVKYTGRGITAVEERELWNAPIVLLLLLAPAERGMGVPACRRPLVASRSAHQRSGASGWSLALALRRRRRAGGAGPVPRRQPPPLAAGAGRRRQRARPLRRPLRLRAAALRHGRQPRQLPRLPPRAAVGATTTRAPICT